MATKLLFVLLLTVFAQILVYGQSTIPDFLKCSGCIEDFGVINMTYLKSSENPHLEIHGSLPNANITFKERLMYGYKIETHFFVRDLNSCEPVLLAKKSVYDLGVIKSHASRLFNLTSIAGTMLFPFAKKSAITPATVPVEDIIATPYYLPKEVSKCKHFELILYFTERNAELKDAYLVMGTKVTRKNGEKCTTYKECPSIDKIAVSQEESTTAATTTSTTASTTTSTTVATTTTTTAATTIAQPTTQAQKSTTKKPKATTKKPNATTKKPKSTTKKPNATTKKPKSTTKKPNATTKKPKSTTKKPKSTTKKPKSTTKKPKPTTAPSPTTTVDPLAGVCTVSKALKAMSNQTATKS